MIIIERIIDNFKELFFDGLLVDRIIFWIREFKR